MPKCWMVLAAAVTNALVPAPPGTAAAPPPAVRPDALPDRLLGPGDRIEVREFVYDGRRSVEARVLNHAVKDILAKRMLTLEDLEAARVAITTAYVKAGYVNSGAVIPPQEFRDGVITFRIVEGTLDRVRLTGDRPRRLRDDFVLPRVWPGGPGVPLNANVLRENLEVLRLNPNVAAVNARGRRHARLPGPCDTVAGRRPRGPRGPGASGRPGRRRAATGRPWGARRGGPWGGPGGGRPVGRAPGRVRRVRPADGAARQGRVCGPAILAVGRDRGPGRRSGCGSRGG